MDFVFPICLAPFTIRGFLSDELFHEIKKSSIFLFKYILHLAEVHYSTLLLKCERIFQENYYFMSEYCIYTPILCGNILYVSLFYKGFFSRCTSHYTFSREFARYSSISSISRTLYPALIQSSANNPWPGIFVPEKVPS